MAELPKYTDFMLPTLKVIRDLGGSGTNGEIREKLIEVMGLTQDQLDATYASGALIVDPRMSWARSYLKLAGLLESGGVGLWVLTDAGRHAADDTEAQLKAQVRIAVAAHNALKKAEQAVAELGEEETADEQKDWADLLLSQLKTMQPDAFERLAQRLLRESGFVRVEVTGKSGDGGIDGSGVLRMNLISFQVLFQCKRYAGSVSAGTVRDFRGAMQGRADKGLIITTGTFTADARREATRDGAPAIDLIDGEALCQLLKERQLGVAVREVRTEEVTVLPEFFADI
ncbi:restriction endonuclease [Novosphingobium sp. KACC 22771]|uniref:restriction endonuclease n=1 Tax=Novosphingobium sp. KACC 22771 TaxID=3025670 RepID=UPI002365D9AF|nr:restriction endonuclease [Novosphingobium sp. KACC 22771]WDF73935.1 restriction endonuclease [Novosphingobium sp. KACC 22771]